MKIVVFGAGYVGLVTATGFAKSGNQVICLDPAKSKISGLMIGQVPFFEPELDESLKAQSLAGRLSFTTDFRTAMENAEIAFVCVGTPEGENGQLCLRAIREVLGSIENYPGLVKFVVLKSTVPVGALDSLAKEFPSLVLAVNPEFLKEGSAVQDFEYPDRVVVGTHHEELAIILRQLHAPFLRTGKPFFIMLPAQAELTKIACNAVLATRISLMNEIAAMAEARGINIDEVRLAIGSDQRIGSKFLFPGIGYGGSCFPKDIQSLIQTAEESGCPALVLEAANATNGKCVASFLEKIDEYLLTETGILSPPKELTSAVWGLSFKPGTDDVRHAPSLEIIHGLLERGFCVVAHDPKATIKFIDTFGVHERLAYTKTAEEAVTGATILVICTEWPEYAGVDFNHILGLMAKGQFRKAIFDGRNTLSLSQAKEWSRTGSHYVGVGRPGNPTGPAR